MDAAQDAAVVTAAPMNFTNENLIKIDTKDEYATAAQMKKAIGKLIPPTPGAAEGTPEAISAALKGLVRTGKNPSTPYLFLAFDTAENSALAAKALDGLKVRGTRVWEVKPVTDKDLAQTHKKGKREREGTKVGDAAEQGPNVAPWMNLPYETEQIPRKEQHCVKILKTINRYSAIKDGGLRTGSLLGGVVRSPMLTGYRNNVQLSCGFSESGEPCIGFAAGATVNGSAAIIPPHGLPTVHEVANAFRDQFMRSVFEPFHVAPYSLTMYNKLAHQGFWRKLHLRHNKDAQVLCDIEYNPTGVEDGTLDLIRAALKRFASEFSVTVPNVEAEHGPAQTAVVASLQWHPYAGTSTSPNETPREVLFGSATLDQHLLGLQFALSPGAFFQVNRPTTELLLAKVADEAQLRPESTVLLDLCCGTGTIGLCLSRYVKRVIGVEMVPAAIENAKENAARNGVTAVQYICGKVEDSMRAVFDVLGADTDVVAILDPPRCGVHSSVLKSLRNCRFVRRVVYISCDQRALETDCEPLCKLPTKQFGGLPFRVSSAFGVDLFPHTPHVEMVVTMQRTTEEELAAGCAGPKPGAADNGATVAAPPANDADAEDGEASELEDGPEAPPQPSAE